MDAGYATPMDAVQQNVWVMSCRARFANNMAFGVHRRNAVAASIGVLTPKYRGSESQGRQALGESGRPLPR